MTRPKWFPATGPTPITRRKVLLGMAAVGGFLAVDLGSVAFAKGWLADDRLSPASFIAAFKSGGSQPGFRKNHAKGVVVTGYFESTGAGSQISRAAVFRSGRTPVQGRFSLGGANPTAPDSPGTPRGLGLAFGFPGREQWRTAMINLPVFPVNSPQGFYDQMSSSKVDPATGKPDPSAAARFQAAHPETVAATALIKKDPPTSGFGDSFFRGLNAFYFVDDAGTRTPVRWTLAPVAPPSAPVAPSAGPNPLFDAVVRQLRSGPLRWQLLITVGTPDDPTDDASLPWPADRRVIDTGTVTLDAVHSDAPGNARDITFDPLVLPNGIEPSDDPLLSARSAVYAASFRLRESEPAVGPAVDVEEIAL